MTPPVLLPAPGGSTVPPGRPPALAVTGVVPRTLVALLLVSATVGWRRGEYFSGSLDPVVVAKGLVSVFALVLAISAGRGVRRQPLGTGSLWFLAVVLVSSLLGALTHGHLLAGG